MTCSVETCERRPRSRGLCNVHYQRWYRLGDPTAGGAEVAKGLSASERFWAKLNKDGPLPEFQPTLGPCWLWTGAIDTGSGYGRFRVYSRGSMALAHRFAWTDTGHDLTDNQQLDHLCRVRHCVRPAHLEPVTGSQNVQRGKRVALRPSPPAVMPKRPRGEHRTHCPQGHPYDETNTFVNAKGARGCRECRREAQRRFRAAKR